MTSYPEVQHRLETITPYRAKEMLNVNKGNRNLRKTVVERYASDMRSQNWHPYTGVIVFDAAGSLIDGQHRLSACVEAGVPFTSLVVRGAPTEVKAGIDQGLKRSLGDLLSWQGEKNANALAAAVKIGWLWKAGRLPKRDRVPTPDEATEWLSRNPSIRATVDQGRQMRVVLGCPMSVAMAVSHRFCLIDPTSASDFLGQVREGVGLQHGDPALTFRNWMINQAASAASQRRPLGHVYHHLWIKAWNAHVQGRDVKQLKYVAREQWPKTLGTDGRPVELLDEVELA